MSKRHEITAGGGLSLVAYEFGCATGPAVLFIHGFNQCHLSWQHQLTSDALAQFRLVAIDNRGHGDSEKPQNPNNYNVSQLWADDIKAVIEQLELKKPVLVGWSYGGLIINDYLKCHGDTAISGINFVAAAANLGVVPSMRGTGLRDNASAMLSPDLETRISGTRRFLRACYEIQPPTEEFETAMAFNMLVPTHVRIGMTTRVVTYEDSMKKISVPSLVTVGMSDQLVLPEMGEYIHRHIPGSSVSYYQGIGHSPFAEAADRFNSELAKFIALTDL